MTQASPQEMSQADFARHMGVSRAAVSQWKSKDILRDDAFTRPGKKGKVIYPVAVEQVRRNRDIGQSLGNGLSTRTTAEAHPPGEAAGAVPAPETVRSQPSLPMEEAEETPPTSAPQMAADLPLPRVDTVEEEIKRARLEGIRRENRMKAAEEALRQGMLMSADDAREQMARIAGIMMQIFEGALPDFASKVAEKFDVPQRDVLHLMRDEFRRVRRDAAKKERERETETEQSHVAALEVEG